jgi:hypothetical protein
MLYNVPRHNYIVYPSWAGVSYLWADLPGLFADPVGSGHLPAGTDMQYYLDCGYPRTPQPFRLWDGPVGGGIIMWEEEPSATRRGKWLPGSILHSEANLREPNGMNALFGEYDAHVVGMEPHGAGLRIPKPKLYLCAASTEHVDAAGDDVYWVLLSRAEPNRVKRLQSVPDWAAAFGLRVAREVRVAAAVQAQFDEWIPEPRYPRTWFTVEGGGDELGFHFAVVVYLAYHLRWVAGKTIVGMHLVSQIEGKPNALRLWNWGAVRRRD